MYRLTCNDAFTASFTPKDPEKEIQVISLQAHAVGAPAKLTLKLEWSEPDIGVNAVFHPGGLIGRNVRPNWSDGYTSCIFHHAPVLCNAGYDDTNRITVACSDAKNNVNIRSGVSEETGELCYAVEIRVDCGIADYQADVRIDHRSLPMGKCVADVTAWWETYEGYTPAPVPEDARMPMYSSWYSFHQQLDVPRVVAECRYFAELGCKTIIVDDGWQTDDNNRGYAFCGDWEPTERKVGKMKDFVDAVHGTGMKFMLWYSVPFVGVHAKAYERFKDKTLCSSGEGTYVLDPRYPEVRSYLIGTYKKAVTDWGLDGLKLDFIDAFRQTDEVKEGMDFVSVYDAVDRLMKDVLAELRQLNPDILVEFRQSYIGPLMRTFGNMFRASDCPVDSISNRRSTLALRLTSGNTAVHPDMLMWHTDEPAEQAAYQLTNTLFSVPQISVLHDRITPEQDKMLRRYLSLWLTYRNVLLDGELHLFNYAGDYSYAYAEQNGVAVGALYNSAVLPLVPDAGEQLFFNATAGTGLILQQPYTPGDYSYTVWDCTGNQTAEGLLDKSTTVKQLDVPLNGTVLLRKN